MLADVCTNAVDVSIQILDDDGKPLPDQPPHQPPLAMKLKQRHLQMIAIGGVGFHCPFSERLSISLSNKGTC